VERSIHSAADLLDTHTVPRTSTMIAWISLNRTWPRLRHTVGFNNGPSPGDKALKPQALSACLPWRMNRRSHRLQFIRTIQSDCGPNRMRPSDSRRCLGASAVVSDWCRCRSLAAGSSRCEFRCECLHGRLKVVVKLSASRSEVTNPRRAPETREAPLASLAALHRMYIRSTYNSTVIEPPAHDMAAPVLR